MKKSRFIHPLLLDHEVTLDDIILPPTTIPNFEPKEVDTTVQLTKRTFLKTPIIGSPMDTVTESGMAILLARMGGIGVIHSGLSIENQLKEIDKVRKWEAGFVLNPAVLGPDATVDEVLKGEFEQGFSSYPITEDGTPKTKVIGIVTKKDIRDRREMVHHNLKVTEIMTPRDKLIFALKKETLDKQDIRRANAMIRTHNLDTLPILDAKGCIVALVTRSDIEKDDNNPLATKDDNKQLKVYAAVESRFVTAQPRLEAIAKSGISGIVIDSRNIYKGYAEIARFAKKLNPNLDVIVGNIVHPAVLKQVLEEAGEVIDAFRVGIGTGEVCITSEELGVGRALASALINLDTAYQKMGGNKKYEYIGFIPDGGIKYPKHVITAATLVQNFSGVMMGSVLAGFDESPGQKVQQTPGVYVKKVRGMGSLGAIVDRAGASRYGVDRINPQERFAEGIEKNVPAIGPGEQVIKRFFAGVQTGLHALGSKSFADLYNTSQLYPVAKAASKGTL
jgi:IMP dehydrogenase